MKVSFYASLYGEQGVEEKIKRTQLKIKKLRSAFTNIGKAIQGRDPSPSSTDSEEASLERESAAEQAS